MQINAYVLMCLYMLDIIVRRMLAVFCINDYLVGQHNASFAYNRSLISLWSESRLNWMCEAIMKYINWLLPAEWICSKDFKNDDIDAWKITQHS